MGRTHALNRAASVSYYGGLRRDLRMAGYTEDNAVFPFTYADASYRLTTAYVGASYAKPLSPKLTWSLNAELEQDLSGHGPASSPRPSTSASSTWIRISHAPAHACPPPRPMR